MLHVTPAIVLREEELDERFVRASGPGGQNVNKVATAVELRFDVASSSLPADVRARLIALAGKRMTDACRSVYLSRASTPPRCPCRGRGLRSRAVASQANDGRARRSRLGNALRA